MGQQVQKTPAEVEKLRADFESLPEAEPEMLGKRQVVVRLMPTIEGMQRKGYTLAMIANKFTENGIPLTVAALKSILSHAGEGGAPAKGKKRRKRKPQAQSPTTATTGSRVAPGGATATFERSASVGEPTAAGAGGSGAQLAEEVSKPARPTTQEPKPGGSTQAKESTPRKGTSTP